MGVWVLLNFPDPFVTHASTSLRRSKADFLLKTLTALRAFFSNRIEPEVFPACAPTNAVQIIGDIHGCYDALQKLVSNLSADTQVVCVGDYIDRGDRSSDVLNYLMDRTLSDDRWVCLRGNHEEMIIDFLNDPEHAGRRWLRNGGLQTLMSYGVKSVNETSDDDAMRAARDALRAGFRDGLEDWLRRLPLSWTNGNLWVLHAAADPKRAMTDQNPSTLLWGNSDSMKIRRRDGIWVAHGHTVVDAPHATAGRIAVDTGAYFTGILTAAVCAPSGAIDFIDNRTAARS